MIDQRYVLELKRLYLIHGTSKFYWGDFMGGDVSTETGLYIMGYLNRFDSDGYKCTRTDQTNLLSINIDKILEDNLFDEPMNQKQLSPNNSKKNDSERKRLEN